MRRINKNVLSGPDTATQTGQVIDSNQMVSASFHAYFGDATAAGTFKIQASNDEYDASYNFPEGSFSPTNWVDIPNATASITSGGAAIITINQTCYRWMRAVYTFSSGGSTTVNVNLFGLSV